MTTLNNTQDFPEAIPLDVEEQNSVIYYNDKQDEEEQDATWTEVFNSCCNHSPIEWLYISGGLTVVLFFLYFFLFGLDLLGSSAKVIGGCTAGSLFGDDQNPVAGVMIGVLVTVLLQSSSTTTSIVVSLVGAGSVSTQAGIYMVMGANIGTSVTNTIVAMGQMGDGDQLERAFAGATVHDMFNFLSVAVIFPIEVITGFLYRFTKIMLPSSVADKDKWEGPVKKLVSPLTKLVIIPNKNVSKDISTGDKTCSDFYPVKCTDNIISYKTCEENMGLISCNKETDKCPIFFNDGALKSDDMVSGGVCLFLSLVVLICCLIGLIWILQKMLLNVSNRILYKASNINGYVAILIGTAITVLVQSSSITTSTLTPLVGMGVIPLEQMFPLTLGANIGTTFTGLMAALVSSKVEALQVALCHVFYNITGILIWYPLPVMRKVPLNAARYLGKATRTYGKLFPIYYLVVVFFLFPLLVFGVSSLFEQDSKGFFVLGIVVVIGLVITFSWGVFKWSWRGGRENFKAFTERRQRKVDAMKTFVDDMEDMKAEIQRLREHTGLVNKNIDDYEEMDLDMNAIAKV